MSNWEEGDRFRSQRLDLEVSGLVESRWRARILCALANLMFRLAGLRIRCSVSDEGGR